MDSTKTPWSSAVEEAEHAIELLEYGGVVKVEARIVWGLINHTKELERRLVRKDIEEDDRRAAKKEPCYPGISAAESSTRPVV